MSGKVLVPEVLWAQRSSAADEERNYIILTVSIPDCENPKVDITASALDLKAESAPHGGDEKKHSYHLHIDFYQDIIPEKSLHKVANGQHYFLKLFKKIQEEEYWPRLTKEKVKYSNIKTDFDKWVDEDEQDEVPDASNDMDFSQMMGGAGGAGGPGGPGGPGGMDMAQLQQMMGGAGGAGGPGGMDMAQLQQMMGGAGGMNFDDADLPEDEGEDEADAEEDTAK